MAFDTKTCLYYWMIEPLRGGFTDTPDRKPVFEIPIRRDRKTYGLAIYLDDNGLPEFARLSIPGVKREVIPRAILPMLQTIREHLLSVLRVTYDGDLKLFPRPIWTFADIGSSYRVGLTMRQSIGTLSFDAERTKQVLAASFPHREELRLLVDGLDHQIPLQYRYLSLYKLLELEFMRKGRWDVARLRELLKHFRPKLLQKGVFHKPDRYFHELRDKCSHIKSSGRRERFGVTYLRRGDIGRVERAMPILTEIAVEVVNKRAKGAFHIGQMPDSKTKCQGPN